MGEPSKRIGILTAGGDCPGLNAAIRGVGKTAIIRYGMEVIGINAGFLGLINNDVIKLEETVSLTSSVDCGRGGRTGQLARFA